MDGSKDCRNQEENADLPEPQKGKQMRICNWSMFQRGCNRVVKRSGPPQFQVPVFSCRASQDLHARSRVSTEEPSILEAHCLGFRRRRSLRGLGNVTPAPRALGCTAGADSDPQRVLQGGLRDRALIRSELRPVRHTRRVVVTGAHDRGDWGCAGRLCCSPHGQPRGADAEEIIEL